MLNVNQEGFKMVLVEPEESAVEVLAVAFAFPRVHQLKTYFQCGESILIPSFLKESEELLFRNIGHDIEEEVHAR